MNIKSRVLGFTCGLVVSILVWAHGNELRRLRDNWRMQILRFFAPEIAAREVTLQRVRQLPAKRLSSLDDCAEGNYGDTVEAGAIRDIARRIKALEEKVK